MYLQEALNQLDPTRRQLLIQELRAVEPLLTGVIKKAVEYEIQEILNVDVTNPESVAGLAVTQQTIKQMEEFISFFTNIGE